MKRPCREYPVRSHAPDGYERIWERIQINDRNVGVFDPRMETNRRKERNSRNIPFVMPVLTPRLQCALLQIIQEVFALALFQFEQGAVDFGVPRSQFRKLSCLQ